MKSKDKNWRDKIYIKHFKHIFQAGEEIEDDKK